LKDKAFSTFLSQNPTIAAKAGKSGLADFQRAFEEVSKLLASRIRGACSKLGDSTTSA